MAWLFARRASGMPRASAGGARLFRRILCGANGDYGRARLRSRTLIVPLSFAVARHKSDYIVTASGPFDL